MFLAMLLLLFMFFPAEAQQARNPFGVGAPAPTAPPSGFIAWILAQQAAFHRALIAGVRTAKEGSGTSALVTAGFLYGVFHAVGPGHGKAIVSSYVFANEQAIRRGVAISFIAALVQALVAIALVWTVLQVLEGTARQIDASVRWIEIASFSLIVAFGLYLTVRKTRALIGQMRQKPAESAEKCDDCRRFRLNYRPSSLGAAAVSATPACGHLVIPDAKTISGNRSPKELLAAAVAAGARPCTGAILILALARAADIFTIGILAVLAMSLGTALATSTFAVAAGGAKQLVRQVSEKTERLRLAVSVVEFAAAVAVTLLGLLLLMGYLSGD